MIKVDGIHKSFGKIHAVRGVSFDAPDGKITALLGPNGAGKSTTLRVLYTVLKPDEGTATIDGIDVVTDDLSARQKIGSLPHGAGLYPHLTARENVAVVTEISNDPMTPEQALDLVDLGDRMDHFPAQLSGGQQQRVAISRAIAKRPAVLLCDEPTGALDSTTGVVVLDALERANREFGTTTVVITHNATIGDMAHRVVHLSNGHIGKIEQNANRRPPRELHW